MPSAEWPGCALGPSRPSSVHTRVSLAKGVTLVELMVGMVIGLIAVLVISQVLLAAEGQKRSTTSGSDAQLTGTLALFTLQRDIEMTGYGVGASQIGLGCTVRALPFTASNGGATRILAPAVITPGASAGDPDSVRILASSKQSFSVPTLVSNDHPKTGAVGVTEFAVSNIVGMEAGDLMIAVPPVPDATNTCTLFKATGAGGTPGKSIAHAADDTATPPWNGSGAGAAQSVVASHFPAAGYPATSYLINLGPSFIDRSFSVVNGSLRMTDFDRASGAAPASVEVFPQVVNLRALYGKDTTATADGSIDVYDDVQPTTADQWARVMAIRLAIVVRSNQYEADEVTATAPLWNLGSEPAVSGAGSSNCPSGGGKCITLKVNGDIAGDEWKHYRYKVYDTVVPLRNIVWRS